MKTKTSLTLAARVALLLALHSVAHSAVAPLAGSNAQLPSVAGRIGIYHWGGVKAKGVAAGVQDIVNLNASVARITLSPRMDVDYNRGTDCIAGFSLAGTLADEDVRSALANPGIKVFMITAYDETSFADCRTHSYLSPEFYSQANTAKIVAEYSDFVYQLYVHFRGTGKTFILSQWEGDNAIYCGSAYEFSLSDEFRKDCLDNYPRTYAGNRAPADSIEGMVLWFKARYLGASRGIERARNEGLTGVEIYSAPEFCTVHMLRNLGMASVLWDVIPRVPFDYVSYSSYESLSDGGTELSTDLDVIRSVAGTDRIILGEMGFSRSASGERLIAWTASAINAALNWGVRYVLQWNLYDQDGASDFGLFDVKGDITELGRFYNTALQ